MRPKCLEDKCEKQASQNYPGEKKGMYCSKHRLDGMIDITAKRCIESNCFKIPTFNYVGEKKGLYCKEHHKPEMISVLKKCSETGCNTRPNFNFPNESVGKYCSKHMKKGMINVNCMKCLEPGCNIIPCFNYLGEKIPIYCKIHKKNEMSNIKNDKCIKLGCNKIASFNYPENKVRIYCFEHKKNAMVNITAKKCKQVLCDTIISNKRYKGYCTRCFIYKFPGEPVARNYKTKECAVSCYIKDNTNVNWVEDKIIEGGCSRKRPDLLVDLGYQVIIVEVDEMQHNNYSCENKRIMELSQDVGHRPIVFIRFNPDSYEKDGKRIRSCWGPNKLGILVIKKKKEWKERLGVLKNTIDYWTNPENVSNKTIEVVNLFFNEEKKKLPAVGFEPTRALAQQILSLPP